MARNDGGENVPAGKYSAHGFVVGNLKIEGVGFFFNDWITAADSPRISRIRSIGMRDDKLLLGVELVPHGPGHVLYDFEHKTIELTDGDVAGSIPSAAPVETAADNVDPVLTVAGRNGTRWVIDRTAKGAATTEVKQYSSSGESLWRLNAVPDQPQPVAMVASMTEDKIYLLERRAERSVSAASASSRPNPKATKHRLQIGKSISRNGLSRTRNFQSSMANRSLRPQAEPLGRRNLN